MIIVPEDVQKWSKHVASIISIEHTSNWNSVDRIYIFFLVMKGPAAGATDAPQPWGFLCNPMMKMTMMIIIFYPFPSNGARVKWNWQGKTEVLGEKPVPVPLCPPQIPHGLTRDRTRASAVGGRRLTAWAMARSLTVSVLSQLQFLIRRSHLLSAQRHYGNKSVSAD
jgi:hypothetical protein